MGPKTSNGVLRGDEKARRVEGDVKAEAGSGMACLQARDTEDCLSAVTRS